MYLITGNHDPYTSWQHDFFSLPPNATMLPGDRPGFALVERDGQPLCLIGGRGYYNQTCRWTSASPKASRAKRPSRR